MTIHIIKFQSYSNHGQPSSGSWSLQPGAASSVASRGCYWALMAFCVLQFLLGKTERVTKMGCLWMNSMVYGRCNELVHGDYHGYSWFINQQTLVGGDWNHGIWIDFPSHHIGNNHHPNWLSYFSEGGGWNHQPVMDVSRFQKFTQNVPTRCGLWCQSAWQLQD